jgi:hypothetical protein
VTGLDARHPASDPVASENLAELTPYRATGTPPALYQLV